MGRRSCTGVALAAALVVGACTSYPPPSEAQSPAGSGLVSGTACEPLDLRSPSGKRVDLSGTWVGGSDVIVARHFGSCIWWEIWSNRPHEPPGTSWRRVYFGTVLADFTIDLRYGDIDTTPGPDSQAPRGDGMATCEIVFGTSGDVDAITLRLHEDRLPGSTDPSWVSEYTRINAGTELPTSPVPQP